MTENTTDKLPQVAVGILGGTGLYKIEGIEVVDEVKVATPFGEPSDSFFVGEYSGTKIAFLSRHGRGHRLLPHEINYQANIYAFKMLGVGRIISVNSVGSLKEEIRPRDVVIPDQFFDRTRRKNTFFGLGVAAHVSLAEPVCATLAGSLYRAGEKLGLRIHPKKTYICIEGPAFSTRAESHVYRSWECDVIGMTSATEAKLCREAEICYASISLITDYDVWRESEESVSVEMILENVAENSENAKALLQEVIPQFTGATEEACSCSGALQGCIVTDFAIIPQETREKLHHILKMYPGQ